MRKYEIMFIVDPNMPESEIDQLNSQVESLITEGGGQIESIEKLGMRKLAYEIERHTEGFYVLFSVRTDGEVVKEVQRRFRVADSVLRFLTVRMDDAEKKLEKVSAIRKKKTSRRSKVVEARAEQPAGSEV